MPEFRAYFANELEARSAIDTAKAKITDRLTAAAVAAGVTPPAPVPTSSYTIEAIEALPIATDLDPTGGLPKGSKPYSRVTWIVESWDGRRERVIMTLPTESIESSLIPAGAIVRVVADYPRVRVIARIPSKLQFQVVDASVGSPLAIGVGEKLVSEASGKKYKTTGFASITAPGTYSISITEDDSAVAGDVTYGSPLTWLGGGALSGADLARLLPVARVYDMAPVTVPADALLTASDGRTFKTVGSTSFSSTAASLSGTLSSILGVVRTDSLGTTTALAVDDVLHFVDATGPVAQSASVTMAVTANIPKGSVLTVTHTAPPLPTANAGTFEYLTTEDVAFDDYAVAFVGVSATQQGAAPNLYDGESTPAPPLAPPAQDTIKFSPRISGVSPLAVVVTSLFFAAGPQKYVSQAIGAELEWGENVRPSGDGRWLAELFTLPRGT